MPLHTNVVPSSVIWNICCVCVCCCCDELTPDAEAEAEGCGTVNGSLLHVAGGAIKPVTNKLEDHVQK